MISKEYVIQDVEENLFRFSKDGDRWEVRDVGDSNKLIMILDQETMSEWVKLLTELYYE